MTYLTDFEGELTKKLEDGTDNTTAIVRWVSEKILASYKNGIIAGKKGSQMKHKEPNSADVSTNQTE